jgi:hypothetical protein
VNVFAEFKLKKKDTLWEIDENEKDKDKPKFVCRKLDNKI